MTIDERTMQIAVEMSEWTEPKAQPIKVVDFDPSDYTIDVSLQNRMETGKKKLTTTSDGFVVNSAKAESICDYFLLNARQGVASHDAVDAITIAIMVDAEGNPITDENGKEKHYFVGGHGRAAGLMLARKRIEENDREHFSTMLELEKGEEVSDDDMDILPELKKLRIRNYHCRNRRDIEWLACLENSDAQNGERLTNAEKRELIDKHLADEAFAQFKDRAFAIRILGDPGCRSTVYHRRKALYKDQRTPYKNGTIDVNGRPNSSAGAGKLAMDKVNKLGQRLEDNFASLAHVPLESRNETTYAEFEKMRAAWNNAVVAADRWLQAKVEDGRTKKQVLMQSLTSLEDEIGYTEYQASRLGVESEVANSQPTDDNEATVDEAKNIAETIKAKVDAGEITPPTPEPEASTPETPEGEGVIDDPVTTETAPAPEPENEAVSHALKVGQAFTALEQLRDKLSAVGIEDVEEHLDAIGEAINVELEAAHEQTIAA